MAFHTFIREKLDVAIVEVGIGGEFDATNIVEKPHISVVTSLGFDHQAILGQTLPEIAWHKAGIMKTDVPCVTTNDNVSVLDVLKRRADELQASCLIIAEDFLKDMNISASALKPGIPGNHQKINAELALVACLHWLRLNDIPYELPDLEQGLTKARWAGRSQSIICKNSSGSDVQVYLDGAHTMESISACLNWYEQVMASNASNNSKKNVLVFYMSGRRDPMPILKLVLSKCQFDQIIFPLNKSKIASDYPDLINSNVSDSEEMQARSTLVETLNELSSDAKPLLPDSIEDCLEEILKNEDVGSVLVTGSLHLVGSVSAALKL
ncbi:hypothetical protein MP638_000854 [Amoeboaphelidium occidentale]|nr:hypothetical protein MP638_000854 [Amoeboaphelidium occidentale]